MHRDQGGLEIHRRGIEYIGMNHLFTSTERFNAGVINGDLISYASSISHLPVCGGHVYFGLDIYCAPKKHMHTISFSLVVRDHSSYQAPFRQSDLAETSRLLVAHNQCWETVR